MQGVNCLSVFVVSESINTADICFNRAPPFPLQCFHGNCFADSVEVVRKDNDVKGLKLFLVAEGK